MKKIVMSAALFVSVLTSCTTMNNSMREPNTRVELVKSDFTVSEQFSAEATTTRILGIDWNRLFSTKHATIKSDNGVTAITDILFQVPVIGNVMQERTSGYALYAIMQDHKGYDVAFYPQYEIKQERPIGLGFIYKKTTVKATTRLAKLKQ